MKMLMCMLTMAIYGVMVADAITVPSCNCVAFRIDDIQDYYLNIVQQEMIDAFHNDSLPVTIGIIANFFGTDELWVDHLKQVLGDPTWDVEVANHGFNHEHFPTFSLENQTMLMKAGVNRTMQVLGTTLLPNGIKTFVPPYNEINNDTYTAAIAAGFTTMSSQTLYDHGPYYSANEKLYRWPEDAASSDESSEVLNVFVGVSPNDTMSEVQAQMATCGFSVVMLHPQEFGNIINGTNTNVVNQTMMASLRTLIASVKAAGYKLVTIGQIQQTFAAQGALSYPPTSGLPVPATSGSTAHLPSTGVIGATTGSRSTTSGASTTGSRSTTSGGASCTPGNPGCTCLAGNKCNGGLECEAKSSLCEGVNGASSIQMYSVTALLGFLLLFI